jgi:arylsulfatase A
VKGYIAPHLPDPYLETPYYDSLILYFTQYGKSPMSHPESQTAHPAGMPANIIYIMADDIGYGDFHCYNPHSRIPTPHIDRLAREGIRFTDAHSPSAVCTPTRYGVLTGRYCWRSALKSGVLYGYEPPLIERERTTVPGLLRENGYRTACFGKWHLGMGYSAKKGGAQIDFDRPLPWGNAEREFEEQIEFSAPLFGGPTDLGFDYFYGTSGCPTCQPPYGFIENERFVEKPSIYHDQPIFTSRPGMMVPGWQHKDADPHIATAAVRYIKEQANSEKPFFMYLCPDAAHEPCTQEVVPDFARGQSKAGARGDLVWLFDWMVGQVMQALEETGQADDTLVIVTSDNGALPGDRTGPTSYRTYGHASSGSWRGFKAHIWEGGHREPFIARWPARIAADSTSDELVCLTDLMATCAGLLGVELPAGAGEDSVDIGPALWGEKLGRPLRSQLVHHSGNGVFSLRQAEWKCIFETQGSGGWPPPRGGPPEKGTPGQLYNLWDDPAEDMNLWDIRPRVVADMQHLLDAQRTNNINI